MPASKVPGSGITTAQDLVNTQLGSFSARLARLEGDTRDISAVTVTIPEVDTGTAAVFTSEDGRYFVTLRYFVPGDTDSLRIVLLKRSGVASQADYENNRIYASIENITDAARATGAVTAAMDKLFKANKQYDIIKIVAISKDRAGNRSTISDPPEDPDYTGYPGNALYSFTTPATSSPLTGSGTPNGVTLMLTTDELTSTSAMTNGQIPIGDTGNAPQAATITPVANQTSVTNGPHSITIGTAQDIATSSSPTFVNVSHTGRAKLASVAATAVEGDLWNDSTQKAISAFIDGLQQALLGVIFTQTANATITNTTTETTLLGSGVGTKTLPAGSLVIGKTIRIKACGFYSTDGAAAGNLTFNLKIGGTTVCTTGARTAVNGAANYYWEIEAEITCRTTGGGGTVFAQAKFLHQEDATTYNAFIWPLINTATDTVDTTASNALDLTVTWGTADSDNTITCSNSSIEVLN